MKYFLLLASLFWLAPIPAHAQTEFREITISPFLQEHVVAKGSTVSGEVEVTNNGNSQIDLQISARDFLPGDRGEPQFVPDEEFNDVTFSLASWLSFPDGTQVKLQPNETRAVRYLLSPPNNAEQGSHYGAILFSMSGSSIASGVGINQSLATILIVSYGEARPEGNLEFSVEPKIIWWNEQVEFTNLFSNTGRVHVKPKGEVYISNIFGKLIASPPTNRDAANVLPQSDRTFVTEWDPSTFAFGPYKVESVITFGNQKLEVRSEQIVWVLPIYILAAISIVLILFLWFIFHGRHWHRRRVIDRHIKTI